MLTPFCAQRFADSWRSDRNPRQDERIEAQYAPNTEHGSSCIVRRRLNDAGSISGREHLPAFIERVIEVNPRLRPGTMPVTVDTSGKVVRSRWSVRSAQGRRGE